MKTLNKDFALFTDVSVNPGLKLGVGAYVMVPASILDASSGVISSPEIKGLIEMRRFEGVSSTRLELQTVLWALSENRQVRHGGLTIYSDSQCIAGLLKRKPRLLAAGFLSKKTNQELVNASLYRTFYGLHDKLGFEVIKVKGHSPACLKDSAHRIFSCVDKEVRKALRQWTVELTGAAKYFADKAHNDCWCVYVLKCSNGYFYIGITNELERRLKEHELGRGSKFVRSWRPFELVKTIPCRNAGEARRLEYSLKRLTRKKKIEVLEL